MTCHRLSLRDTPGVLAYSAARNTARKIQNKGAQAPFITIMLPFFPAIHQKRLPDAA